MLAAVFIVALGFAEPTAAAREEAKAAFVDATKRFAAADYEVALEKFREAYRLAPHDKVRFNIGQCLVRLGRHREAFVELDAAATSPDLSTRERELAGATANEAASHLGRLSFTGADTRTVIVDDTLRCTVPCTMLVDPGTHAVQLEGGSTAQHEVRLRETTEVAFDTTAVVEPPPPIPPPAIDTKPDPVADEPPPNKPRPRPSALTWVGLPLAVLGGAGIIGFGLRANQLHDDYLADPDPSTRDKGITMRNLANASIGVAILGAVLITADAIRIGVARRKAR